LAVGVFGTAGGNPRAHDLLLSAETDQLMVIGSSLGEFSTFGWNPRLSAARTMIQIDNDPQRLATTFHVDLPVVADARQALADLLAVLPHRSVDPAPEAPVSRTDTPTLQAVSTSLHASDVVARLSRLCPDDTLLFVDNGNCLGWVGIGYTVRGPGQMYCSLNLGSMGYSVPAAIGAR
jgi:acetolactate synthase-1/2/3 large subunit